LHEANIDFSVWPLRCGGLSVKIDRRIAAQLLYHALGQECGDPEYLKVRNNPDVLAFANTFHRAGECGKLEVTA
jgi:hypothetical protein